TSSPPAATSWADESTAGCRNRTPGGDSWAAATTGRPPEGASDARHPVRHPAQGRPRHRKEKASPPPPSVPLPKAGAAIAAAVAANAAVFATARAIGDDFVVVK